LPAADDFDGVRVGGASPRLEAGRGFRPVAVPTSEIGAGSAERGQVVE
jgi:hypothetical protein